MLKTLLSSFLLLLSLLLIETVILANIIYLPAVPDMLLIAVMYLALKNGPLVGETTGFVSGLLIDFVSGAPLGLNCLARTVLGYFCGLFNRTLNSTGILIPALLGFCITIIKIILLNIISFFYPQGQILLHNIFTLQFVSELGVNAVITPILFAFFSLFNYLFIQSKNMENLL